MTELRTSSSRPLVVTALLLIINGAGALHADYQTSFRKGMEAYLGQHWAEAERLLHQAIDQNNIESAAKINIYGMIYEPYTPHFFRGVALARMGGRCDEVRSELATSERQGAIKDAKLATEYATLIQTRNLCPPPIAPPVPIPAPTPQPGLLNTATEVTTTTRPIVPDTAGPNLLVPKRNLQVALDDAQLLLANNTGPAPQRVRVVRERVSAAIQAGTSALTSTVPARIDGASASLIASSNEYRRVLTTVPPTILAEAINEYATGHYGKAVSLLANPTSSASVYTAQMFLFRAAARYSQYVAGGERDARLERLALDDIKESRRLDPRFPVSARYFSPRFRAKVPPGKPR